ncbi:AraC family transcriptional regulator [Paenibacillus yonginensis]|uniref:AraC family transcriptional regulator n=1 Tax=Paenibacillus yonginensis TaxID=1462996 RepID=A0A1B1N023_9BACL|nr:response regulator [Paenibacillus yonginensis]ANS74774.1 AraC family transcriptional regulator [Paenibacillus yonginensis]
MKPAPYRVLIADDETIIREGIRDSVDWESLGMEVAAEAEDGEEAYERALELNVQMVLVDMNMPFMDGITLMKNLRTPLPDCRFVIITGHDEFAYAQEAIRLGVEDYILKPVNGEQLLKVLERIRNELDQVRKQTEYLKQASEQIRKNIPLLQSRFGQEWINGSLSGEEISEQLQFLGLPGEGPVQLGVTRWPELAASPSILRESDRQLLLFALENITAELASSCRHMLFRDSTGMLVTLFWDLVKEELSLEVERAARDYLKISVHSRILPVTGDLTSVRQAYCAAKDAVSQEVHLSPLVRRAKQQMLEEYGDPGLTLESFANRLQVSSVYLSRLLKKELGESFVACLTGLRVRKAVQLLNSTDLTILEIAEQVGYESQHYFSTAFKKMMGVSPNLYRKGGAFPNETGEDGRG